MRWVTASRSENGYTLMGSEDAEGVVLEPVRGFIMLDDGGPGVLDDKPVTVGSVAKSEPIDFLWERGHNSALRVLWTVDGEQKAHLIPM